MSKGVFYYKEWYPKWIGRNRSIAFEIDIRSFALGIVYYPKYTIVICFGFCSVIIDLMVLKSDFETN